MDSRCLAHEVLLRERHVDNGCLPHDVLLRERHVDSGHLPHEVSEMRKDSVRNWTGAFRVVFLSRIWHHSACFLRSRVKLHGEMID